MIIYKGKNAEKPSELRLIPREMRVTDGEDDRGCVVSDLAQNVI